MKKNTANLIVLVVVLLVAGSIMACDVEMEGILTGEEYVTTYNYIGDDDSGVPVFEEFGSVDTEVWNKSGIEQEGYIKGKTKLRTFYQRCCEGDCTWTLE